MRTLNFALALTAACFCLFNLEAKEYQIRTVGGSIEQDVLNELNKIAKCNGDSFRIEAWDERENILPDAVVAICEPGAADADVLLSKASGIAGKKVKVFLQQSWPYTKFYTGKDYLLRYDRNQMAMFESIAKLSREACEKHQAGIIPCGAAIQSMRKSVFVENVSSDGVHLNKGLGARTAACTWYSALTGKSCEGVAYKGFHLTKEMSLACEKCADAAVAAPYKISDFGFSKDWKTYDEGDVRAYKLPEALVMKDGTPVKTPQEWFEKRRPELLALFEKEEFGKCPGRPEGLHFKVEKVCNGAVTGRAVMKEIKIFFTADEKHYMTLLLFLPAEANGPVPVFTGINFRGNHTVWDDPRITMPDEARLKEYANVEQLPRGSRAGRWPVDMIVGSGYGLATFFLGDLDPDFDDSFQNGVQPLFYRPGQKYPDPDQWGTIGAWSWGLSRAMDYLETDSDVDASRVAVIGHSRLSKTALWTAARDTRFAMAFPNNPGCSGGAISRRRFGETVSRINRHFPHWFCENYRRYNDKEGYLPFDQHELIALVAPRPIYIASATMDLHGDPKGEFLGALEASKVYEFLGAKGLGTTEMPPVESPVMDGDIAYHIRTGLHNITYYDWAQYIKFADKYFKKTAPSVSVVPQPNKLSFTEGAAFEVKGAALNCDAAFEQKSIDAVKVFGKQISAASGKTSKLSTGKTGGKGFNFVKDPSMKAESYSIAIDSGTVLVKAADHNGLLYAIQTLKQMLPSAVFAGTKAADENWTLPCCTIEDAPRFAYRGAMIDCARHFFSLDEVKKCLDVMALCKCNRLHWHLTDDQGWRVEIKKYPRLTEVGAYRRGTQIGRDRSSCDNIRHGGFYTQEQLKDIIRYADNLGITIVPEIDLPGHMLAALAAYPELGCQGSEPYEVWTRWGISSQVLCVGKESTMKFLEDVLSEVADIFPGEYIHIGGDECPKKEWKTDPDCQAKIRELGLKSDENATAEQRLQNYVTARMQSFLAKKGKKIIGWDEVLEGELAEGATVMSWRGTKGGIKGAKMGYNVIMSPNNYCYIDYVQQGNINNEPAGISQPGGKVISLERIYSLNPYSDIPEEYQKYIYGVQANLWTEYIAAPEHLEYMLLPRLLALSEVQWCQPQAKDYQRFRNTLKEKTLKILDILGYNYRKLD